MTSPYKQKYAGVYKNIQIVTTSFYVAEGWYYSKSVVHILFLRMKKIKILRNMISRSLTCPMRIEVIKPVDAKQPISRTIYFTCVLLLARDLWCCSCSCCWCKPSSISSSSSYAAYLMVCKRNDRNHILFLDTSCMHLE